MSQSLITKILNTPLAELTGKTPNLHFVRCEQTVDNIANVKEGYKIYYAVYNFSAPTLYQYKESKEPSNILYSSLMVINKANGQPHAFLSVFGEEDEIEVKSFTFNMSYHNKPSHCSNVNHCNVTDYDCKRRLGVHEIDELLDFISELCNNALQI